MTARRTFCLVVLVCCLAGGCAAIGPQSSPPGTDVPKIASLRFEPDTIEAGGTTKMTFYFEVGSADVDQAFVVDRGIAQFQLFTTLQAVPISLKQYQGLAVGTADLDLRWSTQGLRWLEVYVVSVKGNVSNRLYGRLTVR
jgi:hypothetical protein